MQLSTETVAIRGIAAAVPNVPELIKDTDYLSPEERKKFFETTGIEKRYLAPKEVCTSDLGQAAAEKLLQELDWSRESVDLLVFVTQSSDYLIPATAISLQHRLGLPKTTAAFDINLGCSGYTYGLSVVMGFLQSGQAKRALLLVGDTPNKDTPRKLLKTTPPIFGDCGTATALEYDPDASPMHALMWSDGSGAEAIMCKYGGSRHILPEKDFIYEIGDDGLVRFDNGFQMDGLEVFNFTVREVPASIKASLKQAELELDAVDYFVFHQANKVINETLRKFLKIPEDRYPYSLFQYGNTSSATIPLTIASEVREAVSTGSRRLLLSGFGVGLSWSNVVCQLDKIVCPEVILYEPRG